MSKSIGKLTVTIKIEGETLKNLKRLQAAAARLKKKMDPEKVKAVSALTNGLAAAMIGKRR